MTKLSTQRLNVNEQQMDGEVINLVPEIPPLLTVNIIYICFLLCVSRYPVNDYNPCRKIEVKSSPLTNYAISAVG